MHAKKDWKGQRPLFAAFVFSQIAQGTDMTPERPSLVGKQSLFVANCFGHCVAGSVFGISQKIGAASVWLSHCMRVQQPRYEIG
jgi:hypothetical protein